MQRHLKLDEVKLQASTHQRKMIPPRVDVKVTTASDRKTVVETVRRVIAEHRDVLIALKDR